MSVFLVVLNKTAIMLGLMGAGYLFARKGLVSEKAGRDLSVFEVRLFLPAYLFGTLSQNVVPSKIAENLKFFLYGIVFVAALWIFTYAVSRLVPGSRSAKTMFYYILLYPNFGYFGYPVVEAVFGSEVLAQYIMFVLPMTILVYTHGAYVLTTATSIEEGGKFFSKKTFKTIPVEVMLAVFLGAAVGLSGLRMPGIVSEFMSFTGACMSPVSMLLAGVILSTLPLKKLFKQPAAYWLNAAKLLALPLVVGLVLYIAGLRGMFLAFPVIVACLPIGMNVVIFSKPEQPDYTKNGVTCFISYILALATVPAVFAVLSLIM